MKNKVKDYLKRDVKAFGTTMKQMGKWYLIIGAALVAFAIVATVVLNVPLWIWIIIGYIMGGIIGIVSLFFWLRDHPGGVMMGISTLIGIGILCYVLFGVFHIGAPT